MGYAPIRNDSREMNQNLRLASCVNHNTAWIRGRLQIGIKGLVITIKLEVKKKTQQGINPTFWVRKIFFFWIVNLPQDRNWYAFISSTMYQHWSEGGRFWGHVGRAIRLRDHVMELQLPVSRWCSFPRKCFWGKRSNLQQQKSGVKSRTYSFKMTGALPLAAKGQGLKFDNRCIPSTAALVFLNFAYTRLKGILGISDIVPWVRNWSRDCRDSFGEWYSANVVG